MTTPPGTLRLLSQAVRTRRLSATRLVEASLSRLEAATELNVLALACFDTALAQARDLDRDGPGQGPLAGVPLLVKDLDDLAGWPTRKGSRALFDAPAATSNATVPQRLLDAGAIAVGKSTLPEFAIEGYTANLLTGVTRNPWNLAYSPGGSSGGSAAALSGGLVAVATATDGGGSVRIPASLCGLVGLKPTNGVIGRWPAHDWIDYSTDGPMATSCEDLGILLDVMRGRVDGDPTSPPRGAVTWPRHRDQLIHLVAAERTSPLGPLDQAVGGRLRSGVEALAERLGARIEWIEPADFFHDGDPDLDWFPVTSAEHIASLGRGWVLAHFDEFHPATQEFFSAGLEVTVEGYLAARRRRFHYVRRLDELLGEWGLLVTPTVAAPGWLADGRMTTDAPVRALAPEVYSTAMQNVTGNPAITIPWGSLPQGLPFGLQVTAAHFHDFRLLDIAALMERAYPWARTAPGYEALETVLDLA